MSALDVLDTPPSWVESELRKISTAQVSRIAPSPTNPRKHFDGPAMADLTESVRQHGVLQPILLRPWPATYAHQGSRPTFEIVSGERRWRAAKAAGVLMILCVVRDLSTREVLEIQIIENLQRADLHPLEEADGYARMRDEHGYTADELAAKIGKSKGYIYGRLKFSALGEEGRRRFYAGDLNPSTALLIARIPTSKLQEQAITAILGDREYDSMSVREAREHIQNRYMLHLDKAPWPLSDAKLLPEAGSCTACSKRTGCQPEIFDDVGDDDVCTDIECYAQKKIAHVKLVIAQARISGQQAIEGVDGQKALNQTSFYLSDNSKYTALDAKHWADGKNHTFRELLGDVVETILVEDAAHGRVVEVIETPALHARLEAAGVIQKQETSDNADYEAKRNAAAKRVVAENRYRQALWDRCRDQVSSARPLSASLLLSEAATHQLQGLLRLFVTRSYLLMGQEHQYQIADLWHSEGKNKTVRVDHLLARIETLTTPDLARMMLDITLIGGATTNEYLVDKSQPLVMLEAAKLLGIDAEAIRNSSLTTTPASPAKKGKNS